METNHFAVKANSSRIYRYDFMRTEKSVFCVWNDDIDHGRFTVNLSCMESETPQRHCILLQELFWGGDKVEKA